ncbi:MAG: DUF7007 domain-containing protein, partial [Haliea sp.]
MENFQRVFPAAELEPNTSRAVEIEGHKLLVCNAGGEFYTVANQAWGPVQTLREVAPGAWIVGSARGRGILLAASRVGLLPAEFRAQGEGFPEGMPSSVPVVHFPFLPWFDRAECFSGLARALQDFRVGFPEGYEHLLGIPASELGVALRRRRASQASHLLHLLGSRGFDADRY